MNNNSSVIRSIILLIEILPLNLMKLFAISEIFYSDVFPALL